MTIDPVTGLTSNPKVYAAGDVIFGEGQGEAMVVSAAQQGKKTAYAIYKQLVKQGKNASRLNELGINVGSGGIQHG